MRFPLTWTCCKHGENAFVCVFNAFEMGYVVRVRCQQCRWNTPQPVQNASLLQVKCVCMRLKQALRHALTPLQRNSLFQSCQIRKDPHFSNFLLGKGNWLNCRKVVCLVKFLSWERNGNFNSSFREFFRNSLHEKSWVFCTHN